MKRFTHNLMLVAAAATALGAGAEATWQINMNSKDFKVGVQAGRGIMADFNNDGRLDIYYSGTGRNDYYDHHGLTNWQNSSNMLYNNGDGTFTEDIITVEPTGEFDQNSIDDEGNPKEIWRYIDPKHGILPTRVGHYATFDYNNDGLVDLLVSGMVTDNNDAGGYYARIPESMKEQWSNGETKWAVMVLYKNIGDGRFVIEDNCNLPPCLAENNYGESMYMSTMAWGDYDHDGYVDVAFSGRLRKSEPGKTENITQLWRNIDGTGKFEQMNIAETKGGAWVDAIEQDGVEIYPEWEIENGFLPLSGNAVMADINNDGWLDLIFDGWVSKVKDGVYEGGSNGRVYLNTDDGKGGRKFVDITASNGMFNLVRSGNTQLADFNGDGYLDIINGGYGDHNFGWKIFFYYNALGNGDDIDPEEIFNVAEDMGQYGLPSEDDIHFIVRDFDGDDCLDIIYVGKQDGAIYYGNLAGTFDRSPNFPIRNNDSKDGFECFGDLTGNGLCDRFQTGWKWVHDNAEMDGQNYREILGMDGDWTWAKFVWHNTTDVEIEAPETPANIRTSIDETAKTITIEWDDVESPNCAYNVVVLTPSGKVIANIPVDPVTGALKVAENKNIAIRPFVNKYTLPYNEVGEYKMGVQALSLNNEKASAIAWGQNLVAGVGNITTDLTDNDVKVTVNGNSIVANATANADVKVIDMMGRTIATGVTNAPVNVEANGVLIVNVAGKSVKVVK